MLGVGASGRVYRGTHLGLERRAAIKVFTGRVLEPGRPRERFLREAGALTRLEHPNVVRLYDAAVTDEEIPYLAMEWIDGVTLADAMRVGITQPRALLLGAELARGLEAIHAEGFVHRDLKPANVMLVAADGTAKIVDFGIVRSDWFPTITAVDSIVGTPLYMAPEQLLESRSAAAPADLYALGAILFRMLSGEPHIHATDLWSILNAQLTERPRPLAPDLGPCGALVDRMLDKEPEHRPSAAEVAEVFAEHAPTPESMPMTRVLTQIRAARRTAGEGDDAVVPSPLTFSDGETSPMPSRARSRWPVAVAALVVSVAIAYAWVAAETEAPVSSIAKAAPEAPRATPVAAPSEGVRAEAPHVTAREEAAERPARRAPRSRRAERRVEAPPKEPTPSAPDPAEELAAVRRVAVLDPPTQERSVASPSAPTPSVTQAKLAARVVKLGARNREAGGRLPSDVARRLDLSYLDLRTKIGRMSPSSTPGQLASLVELVDAFERDLEAALAP